MDSTTPDGHVSASARLTTPPDPSSPDTGPTSPAGQTFVMSHTRTSMDDADRWEATNVAGALTAQAVTHGLHGRALISSSAGSPARTSASPAGAPDSPGNAAACGGSSTESLSLFDPAPYSWRTSKASSAQMVAETWVRSSTPWLTSGMAQRGEFSTRSTSVCPSGADACSCSPSLADVLEQSALPRYSLSPRAARGILRRAEARGRELPEALAAALRTLSGVTPGQGVTATEASSSVLSQDGPQAA